MRFYHKVFSLRVRANGPRGGGFTLIELIIAIVIVAILSTIAISVFSNVQKKGRDVRRQADLKTVQQALEQYRIDQGFYPSDMGDDYNINDITRVVPLTNNTGNPTINEEPKIYLQKIPYDPQSSGDYRYVYMPYPTGCSNASYDDFCTKYCIYNRMEDDSNAIIKPSPCDSSYTIYNYGVTPP